MGTERGGLPRPQDQGRGESQRTDGRLQSFLKSKSKPFIQLLFP